jgi:CubicO group peptidase (beta-lactamase class C family)
MADREQGDQLKRVERALQQIDDWIGPQGVNGAAAAVWWNGDLAAERYAGEGQPGLPISATTMFGLASVTKPVTAATVMSLVEDGLFAIDEPVYRFVPEFAAASEMSGADPTLESRRREITIRQLLAHTSGLPEDLPAGTLRYRDANDLSTMTDALTRLPLRSAPGEELLYSNAGYALLGRIVERETDADFWAAAKRRVLDPLDLNDTIARPGPEYDNRIAIVADTNHAGSDVETYNSHYWRSLAMPWGGLYGSARDLVRFASSFLDSGPKLLSCASVELMTTDQAQGVSGGVQSMRITWQPAVWGLGWEVKGNKRRHWTGELTSPRTFCHFGAAGTLLWGDPEHNLALAVFGNRMTTHLWPFVPAARWSRLSNALVAAVS